MIPKKIQAAFNAQIKAEMESSYLYLSMAAYFKSQTLDGMEHWMKVQAKEEMGHAMKFFDFILERGGRVELAGLAEPKAKWSSALDAFRNTYEHEQVVTGKIHALVKLAESQDDPASSNFLQWFVNEQVEEEANALEIVVTLERVGASGAGLIMLDRELGKRE
jgi:ferritin